MASYCAFVPNVCVGSSSRVKQEEEFFLLTQAGFCRRFVPACEHACHVDDAEAEAQLEFVNHKGMAHKEQCTGKAMRRQTCNEHGLLAFSIPVAMLHR